ncbi:NACHT, LRR and PYD domains-containing protein 12-like, partial [Clarias magur]
CVSMKSCASKHLPVGFVQGDQATDLSLIQVERSRPPEPNCGSLKSNRSSSLPIHLDSLSDEPRTKMKVDALIHSSQKVKSIFKEVEHEAITLLKKELSKFQDVFDPEDAVCSERVMKVEEDLSCTF